LNSDDEFTHLSQSMCHRCDCNEQFHASTLYYIDAVFYVSLLIIVCGVINGEAMHKPGTDMKENLFEKQQTKAHVVMIM